MKKLLLLLVVINSLCIASLVPAFAENTAIYQSTFGDEDKTQWSGWANEDPSQRLEFVPDAEGGQAALHLSVAGDDWNTAILSFPQPIKITPRTVLRYKLKAAFSEGVNIHASTGARYFIKYPAPPSGDWFPVQKYLAAAGYKSGGGGSVNDLIDIVGSSVTSIQIATKGKDVWISDLQILEADQPLPELPAPPVLYQGEYKPIDYPLTNTFFPYGVIYQHRGEMRNADLFGQDHLERYDTALGDIKRHYMNTFSNFVDSSKIEDRLRLAQKYDLRLIETRYAGIDLATSPNATDIIQRMSGHPSLLAWYGTDEPTDYKAWLDSKLFINAIDQKHPYTSAFNHLDNAIALGPYSEVVMVDPYSTIKTSGSIHNLLWHANYARIAKRYTAGKKLWFIAQTYGNRKEMRYNTPAEARFEVFNCLSAGVDGLIFFIYNDMSSYLMPPSQRDKFDETLVDPWFNGNPTYDELARIGRDVIPAMHSLIDKTEIDGAGFTYNKKKIVLQAFKAKPGNLIIVANKDLDKKYQGDIKVPVARGQAVYDLIQLAPVPGVLNASSTQSIALDLAPGDGGLYMVAGESAWQALKKEVTLRKLQAELELANLETSTLKTAAFNTTGIETLLENAKTTLSRGNTSATEKTLKQAQALSATMLSSKPEYLRQKSLLQDIRQNFGTAHTAIKTSIATIDGTTDPAWHDLFAQIKSNSNKYFELNRKLQSGDLKSGPEIEALKATTLALQNTIQARVAGPH